MKKSKTKNGHLVLEPSQKSQAAARVVAGVVPVVGSKGRTQWCSQSCRDASRIQEGVMQNLSQIHQLRLC